MLRYLTLIFGLFSSQVLAQTLVTPDARWTARLWDANWIAPQGNSSVVVYFRKSFTLPEKPHRFIIHISADSRYRLFINGRYAGDGPQISDLRHYRFESLDISTFLNAGKNTIAAEVWNLGEEAPVYQMGKRLALIVQGNDSISSVVNSDKTWKYQPEPNITPIHFGPGNPDLYYHYYAAGPMDKVSAGVLWDWEKPDFNDVGWKSASQLQRGTPFLKSEYGDAQWELMPRSIPLMERTYQSFAAVRKSSNASVKVSTATPFLIGANQKISVLLDQRQMTTAFPEVIVSKGKASEIRVTYAESIYDDPKNKGHRDSVNAKIHGVYDLFYPDGGQERKFTTLSYRAFRYVQLDITTGAEPLTIEKIGSWFTGYPFKKEGMFKADDADLEKVFDIGWRTERLCSYETYMDCPYWERLQYIGDTRIQALVSYYVSGDDRLARNAISQFEWSMQYDGLTGSRYPSALPQYIPNYSLVWVLMVHDYMMYRNDPEFVKSFLPGIKRVLEHFKQYLTQDYMMQQQPYWDFIDHTFSTKKVVEASLFKKLTTNSLFYSYTLSRAADIFGYFNDNGQAQEYIVLSQRIKESVRKQCWDANSEMYADTPDKKSFSMHSNILAVLCGMMPKDEQEKLLKRIVSNKGITQTTLYFDFYLARAMSQAGAGGLYYDMLSKWKDLLNQGLTTFPEGVSPSDCHAWSASPDFEMAATLAGIEPQSPGFRRVIVRPQLQKLTNVEAKVPHWAGEVHVIFEKKGKSLSGLVILPAGINGRLEWGEKSLELAAGENVIKID
jgi:alpha-L-rhamnosidase